MTNPVSKTDDEATLIAEERKFLGTLGVARRVYKPDTGEVAFSPPAIPRPPCPNLWDRPATVRASLWRRDMMETLLVAKDSSATWIILNRPDRANAPDPELERMKEV